MTDWEEISTTYVISRVYKKLPQFNKKNTNIVKKKKKRKKNGIVFSVNLVGIFG